MLLTKIPALTAVQQEVLAALHAYDMDGQARFRKDRQISSEDWRRTLWQLMDLGLVRGRNTLTTLGEEYAHGLPKQIRHDI